MLGFLLNLASCSTPNIASCFDSATFDHVLRYCIWYAETRKINRVLINDFEMEILEKRIIALKQDGHTIAQISKENGISILPVKQNDRLKNSIHEAYCNLAKNAKTWREHYQ